MVSGKLEQYRYRSPSLRPSATRTRIRRFEAWSQAKSYSAPMRYYASNVVLAILAYATGYLLLMRFMDSIPKGSTELVANIAPALAIAFLVPFGATYDAFVSRGSSASAKAGFIGTATVLCALALLWTGVRGIGLMWLPWGMIGALFAAPGLSPMLRSQLSPSSYTTAHRRQFFGVAIIPMLFGAFIAASELGAVGGVQLLTVVQLFFVGALVWLLVEPALQFRDVEESLFAVPLSAGPEAQRLEPVGESSHPIDRQSRMELRLLLTGPPLVILLTLIGALDVTFVAIVTVSYAMLVLGTFDVVGLMGVRSGLRLFRLFRRQFVFMVLLAVALGSVELVRVDFTASSLPSALTSALWSLNALLLAAFLGSLWGMLQSLDDDRLLPYWVARARTLWATASVCWLGTVLLLFVTSRATNLIPSAHAFLGRAITLNFASLCGEAVGVVAIGTVCFSRVARRPESRASAESEMPCHVNGEELSGP